MPDQVPAVPEGAPTAPEYVPVEPTPQTVPEVPETPVVEAMPGAAVSTAVPEELVEQVQQLVDTAFTKGVPAAVDEARKIGNPALVDALHATLSEPAMHDALESRGKLSVD